MSGAAAIRHVHGVGKLHVLVKSAEFKNVTDFELIGKVDPYVKVSVFNELHQTSIQDNTEAPVFNEEFEITSVGLRNVRLIVEAWDHDIISDDDLIGRGLHEVQEKVYSTSLEVSSRYQAQLKIAMQSI